MSHAKSLEKPHFGCGWTVCGFRRKYAKNHWIVIFKKYFIKRWNIAYRIFYFILINTAKYMFINLKTRMIISYTNLEREEALLKSFWSVKNQTKIKICQICWFFFSLAVSVSFSNWQIILMTHCKRNQKLIRRRNKNDPLKNVWQWTQT